MCSFCYSMVSLAERMFKGASSLDNIWESNRVCENVL